MPFDFTEDFFFNQTGAAQRLEHVIRGTACKHIN